MNSSRLKPLFILMLLFSCEFIHGQSPIANGQNLKVIILRHGEKPDKGDNLSCQGLNRAILLADVLYNKFKLPDYIYVPSVKTGKGTGVARMYQTIVPFAVKYNLNIDTQFEVDDPAGLAKSILKKTGTVIVVWEHKNIPAIVAALGVDNARLKWNSNDFDSMWIISIRNGKASLNYDKENLVPVSNCK